MTGRAQKRKDEASANTGAGENGNEVNRPSRFRLYGQIPVWLSGGGDDCDVVVSTRIRLARNIADKKFPSRASAREKIKIFENVSAVLSTLPKPFNEFEVIDFSKLRKVEQHFMVEERLVSIDMLRGEWTRGVACDAATRKYSVMINEEDHLRIQGMEPGFRSLDMWEKMSPLDDAIGERLPYAYSPKVGHLTSCPSNSGTGMRVSYLVHLPALVLTRAIDPVLHGAAQLGVSTRGFAGEKSQIAGNLFQLSNMATLGGSEEYFIKKTRDVVADIVKYERQARERLKKEALLEIKDKVARADGILNSAVLLNLHEMLNLLSALKLGIECGVYHKHRMSLLNKILILGMPAHLQIVTCSKPEYADEYDPDFERANLVREILQAPSDSAQDDLFWVVGMPSASGASDTTSVSESNRNSNRISNKNNKNEELAVAAPVKKKRVVKKKVAKKSARVKKEENVA